MKRYLLFGCSRGLGKEVLSQLTRPEDEFLLVSRTMMSHPKNSKAISIDCTKENDYKLLFDEITNFSPHIIYYFSGGGPYGNYFLKKFEDHNWAFKLNFLFPALLLHKSCNFKSLEQIIFTGSSVAESEPDKGAASYAASKHALKGLISSINLENPSFDVRLFSPSYMQTSMLPQNAPVHSQFIVDNPGDVASDFIEWAQDKDGAKHHFIKVRNL